MNDNNDDDDDIIVDEVNPSIQLDENASSVVEKFKNFRRDVDIKEKKLEESQVLIDQLRDDMKVSREMEKHLRDQVASAQNRSVQLQIYLHKFAVVSEQQRKNEAASKELEKNIEEIHNMIKTAQENLKNLYSHASFEKDLLVQNNELKSVVEDKESQLNLLKINMQAILKEKSEMILKFETKINELEEELKKSKWELSEMKNEYDRNVLVYKKEIEEKQEMLMEYERERRGLFEDFDTSKKKDKIYTFADSTVSLNTEERGTTDGSHSSAAVEIEREPENDLFVCTTNTPVHSFKTNTKFRKKGSSQKQLKTNEKPKPELQFLLTSQPEPEHSTDFSQPPPKRRLFSTNCNHYFN